jgi:hypothetical protein
VSPPFYVPPGVDAVVSFATWMQTEDPFVSWDRKFVQVSLDDGATWEEPIFLGQRFGSLGIIALGDLGATGCLRLRFGFNGVDDQLNDFPGWVVDDVVVYASRADLDWTPLDAGISSSMAPVLVGDERGGSEVGGSAGVGRLYAFTIDGAGDPWLAAHDMATGFGAWQRFPGSVRLVPGSASAVSRAGYIAIAARGVDGLPYAVTLWAGTSTVAELVPFEALGTRSILGRPALAASGVRFHLVARSPDPSDRSQVDLLHAETASLTGAFPAPAPIARTAAGATSHDPALTTSGASDAIWGGDALHLLYVDASGTLRHSVKPEGGAFGSAVLTGLMFASAAPAAAYFHGSVHAAIQTPLSIAYARTSEDGSWPLGGSSSSHVSSDAPRLVELFGSPFLFSREDTGEVRFFQVDVNLPGQPIASSGALHPSGASPWTSTAPIEATRSFAEIYVAAHGAAT